MKRQLVFLTVVAVLTMAAAAYALDMRRAQRSAVVAVKQHAAVLNRTIHASSIRWRLSAGVMSGPNAMFHFRLRFVRASGDVTCNGRIRVGTHYVARIVAEACVA